MYSLTMDDKLSDDEVYFKKRPIDDHQRHSSILSEKVATDDNGNVSRGVKLLDRKTDHVANEDTDMDDVLHWSVERRTADIAYRFMVTTTAHGWAHVARGYNTTIKIAWLVLTLSAFTVNVIPVVGLVMQFKRYPYEQVRPS